MVSCVKCTVSRGGRPYPRGGMHASGWWRMMCNIREGVGSGMGSLFDDNIRRVVGNDRNTCFWTDSWLGGVHLRIQFSRLYELSVNRECSVEEMARQGWDE